MAGLLAAGLNFYIRSQLAGDMVDRQSAQAAEACQSGVALVSAMLMDPAALELPLDDNTDLFRDVVVVDGPIDWRFSIVRPPAGDDAGSGGSGGLADSMPRFGITDESGKINLNTVTAEQLAAMALPGMTAEIIDAIMDWRDGDTEARPLGAEEEYYEQLEHPYSPKNGLFESVEELLLVKGVTEALLYGEDMNRNGLLDPNENDGDKSLPPDSADGQLNRGWYPYLTVYSVDWGLTSDGQRPININNGRGRQLVGQLKERGVRDELADWIGQARDANVRFAHPAQLLGFEQEVTIRGKKQTLTSPANPDDMPVVLDHLWIANGRFAIGRLNPAAASRQALLATGFTEDEANQVIEQAKGLEPREAASPAWLITRNLLSVDRFVELAPRLTGRGRQFRVEVIGYSRTSGLFKRVEMIIDIGRGSPRTMYYRDLTGLGPAYRLDEESLKSGGTFGG